MANSDFILFVMTKNGIVKTEETLSIVINNQKVEGRADIMIENENEIELVDIKTGKAPSKADIKNYEDIQLGLYR